MFFEREEEGFYTNISTYIYTLLYVYVICKTPNLYTQTEKNKQTHDCY